MKSVSKFGGYLLSLQKYLVEVIAVEFQYLQRKLEASVKKQAMLQDSVL